LPGARWHRYNGGMCDDDSLLLQIVRSGGKTRPEVLKPVRTDFFIGFYSLNRIYVVN